ncbi:hepatic and glial cell adhesion molecule-like [Danio aesculapii]|uniref:hepatic and glial cell adhesion molecule-like n=1 Tax=Danio aesculapii TaxID=1142201 RepID=UPI0024C05BE3|nr:hepatic and glial cell adhesion molecule-like [Danio aesculapii]
MLKLKKMIHLIVFNLTLLHLFGVSGAVTVKPVMVGESVTLEIQGDGDIEWKFRPHNILIAHINRDEIALHDDILDGSFRGRLKLDQTGSLIINNTRITDSGDYKAINTTTEMTLDTFRLTVYAPLPVPVIFTLTQHQAASSESRCVLLCSVLNVSAVSLSWYKGNSLLSNMSVSDLSISLFLPLEVEYQNNNTYSCVVKNPIRNHTTYLETPCNTHSENGLFPKHAILLVLSAVVGVAMVTAVVTVLVYKLISRCLQKKKRAQEEAKNAYSSLVFCKK